MKHWTTTPALLFLALFAMACGDGKKAAPDDPEGPWLPWSEGNTWTYEVTDANGTTVKTQTVKELTLVGGTGPNAGEMAHMAVTTKQSGEDETHSWQAVREIDGFVTNVRFRSIGFGATTKLQNIEEQYEPYKVRFSDRFGTMARGETWNQSYQETKIRDDGTDSYPTIDHWTVVSHDERYTVKDVDYKATHVKRRNSTTGNEKHYWFVRGIGKVLEKGGQEEELIDFTIQP